MRILLLFMLCSFTMESFASQDTLKGFHYRSDKSPIGNEWESPENLALNKEQPKAYFFPFQDVNSARNVLAENSKYWQSLNGDWAFNWAPDPDSRPKNFFELGFNTAEWDTIKVPSNWNIVGIQKNGDLKYGVPIYVNQPVIFKHSVKVDDWRGGVMRTPPANWTTYKHRNEVGSFRREFEVSKDWKDREVFISFDGVDSFFYLWINGEYVGFSKNSRNTASFNITPYLQKGKNVVAAEVYRSSDGSFLEAQDMFRLPGIYRNVCLYSTPKVHVRNIVAISDLDNTYNDGKLNIKTDIRNLSKKTTKEYTLVYSLYENELFSDDNSKVENVGSVVAVKSIKSNEIEISEVVLDIKSPNKWSAEHPYRYTLVAELKDNKGKVIDVVSTIVGFRKVEIKDTPASEDEFGLAGRYYYVNGETVKLKGVNRHESNPETGHVITRERMQQEMMLLKRANINHVRNAHYTDDPYWYFLCDKYGIYLEDEANVESHQYYYGEASLSHPIEWKNAHVARVMEMVYSNINNPSIVIWSLGNEGGPGDNFVAAYDALKKVDTSRPVQYERNNSIVDMGSNQYPSIAWTKEAVKGKYAIKYPFHISEYAHSMGNACGNLDDYWEAIESTNFFCGAAIWDWVDQSMYNYTKDGHRYLAYGGDFGDTPNDGQFVMNGIVFGNLEPKPQYYEVKKVYQHIDVDAIDVERGTFVVFNKYYFSTLANYKVKWSLYEDGEEVKSGFTKLGTTNARERSTITIPYGYNTLKDNSEYFVKIQFLLKDKTPWADVDFVQAEEQVLVKQATTRPAVLEDSSIFGELKNSSTETMRTIKGDDFEVEFDLTSGTIYSLVYGNESVITDGNGPKLDALRAFVNNDNWFYSQWYANGLHNLKHKAISSDMFTQSNGAVVLSFTVESQAPNGAKILGGTSSGRNSIEELKDKPFGNDDFKFTTNQIWTVYKDGSIELQSSITSNKPSLILPRLGYVVEMPKSYSNFSYYGRGPIGNYADRKTGQFIEQYDTTVKGQFVNFPKPQDMANHEDVRWCALTNESGSGAIFVSTGDMSVSALPNSALDLTLASHIHTLPKRENTYLHLDLATTGLGGNSCGQGGPLVEDRIYASQNNMGFIIRPVAANQKKSELANVSQSGVLPISITRSQVGVVVISSLDTDADICYSINNGEQQQYMYPISLREGGSVEAWFKDNDKVKTSTSYNKIESVQTEVIFASSQEVGEGDASHLVDGDINTIWHTMYSVTVAKHPHWIDLDMGEVKSIKGFNLSPRRDNSNGRIKEYTIHISLDGKQWGEPIHKGVFTANEYEKKVSFKKEEKTRFIRFTAISSHGNQDFATGAEIVIIGGSED